MVFITPSSMQLLSIMFCIALVVYVAIFFFYLSVTKGYWDNALAKKGSTTTTSDNISDEENKEDKVPEGVSK